MSDYLTWVDKVKQLSLDWNGITLGSANIVKFIEMDGIGQLVLKKISPERPYVSRIKSLGEVAYALLDYHLGEDGRVTPNVYATEPDTIWRTFVPGITGDEWRGNLYGQMENLARADVKVFYQIRSDSSAERIALLDMIFLCQDRSARNWVIDESTGKFGAIDNNMFWAYKGRFGDKRTIRTGEVDHLQPPMDALVSKLGSIQFANGLFSSLYVEAPISPILFDKLVRLDWAGYFDVLGQLICSPLGYPSDIIDDWRFALLQRRGKWFLDSGRFPTVAEASKGVWAKTLIDQPKWSQVIWRRQWETENLET